MMKYRECGCSAYLDGHNTWCEDTPIFAQLVKETGSNPADTWPYLVFALIGTSL